MRRHVTWHATTLGPACDDALADMRPVTFAHLCGVELGSQTAGAAPAPDRVRGQDAARQQQILGAHGSIIVCLEQGAWARGWHAPHGRSNAALGATRPVDWARRCSSGERSQMHARSMQKTKIPTGKREDSNTGRSLCCCCMSSVSAVGRPNRSPCCPPLAVRCSVDSQSSRLKHPRGPRTPRSEAAWRACGSRCR